MINEHSDNLNKAWKGTCRVLFGKEIGELREYEEWLTEYLPLMGKQKSCISGKEVALESNNYCSAANFISADEIKEETIEPLSINEIKDIDSIIEAISEKWKYAGNKCLGNSECVESSDLIMDSQYVTNSSNIVESRYVVSSCLYRQGSRYIFGSTFGGASEFLIRGNLVYESKRVFESQLIMQSGDAYLSHDCIGCDNIMFCFFQRNKRNCIGNLELPNNKYAELKNKLLKEIVEELEKLKKFSTLFSMVPDKKPPKELALEIPKQKEEENMEIIEKSFLSTFKTVLKKEPVGLDKYEKWLSKHTIRLEEVESPFGNKTCLPKDMIDAIFLQVPRNRVVSFIEGIELGKLRMDEKDLDSIEKIKHALEKIGYFSAELVVGHTRNCIKAPILYHASNVYNNYDSTYSEYAGINSMSLNCKYIFGCGRMLYSQFCINCYNSLHLNRCFETDTSEKCSDAYFCHNSEGLAEAMFCFNIKGKRHVIGNLEVKRDRYIDIKNAVLEQITDELEKTGSFRYDIFNIGCKGGG